MGRGGIDVLPLRYPFQVIGEGNRTREESAGFNLVREPPDRVPEREMEVS